ncbi:MAG: DUF11 domain-containing protein [Candidatus Nomurabacteria bacterium]|jgi:uncharacterized repeat protein (TIGR01451 family)|nr:DUF11 domain-containing protein [Candidatus Nomurabacteria bacterium]
MKTNTKLKLNKLIMPALALLSLASFLPAYTALAWGPDRPTFTMEKPASYPTFNSITNNPVLGDERNFVRVAEKGAGVAFSDEIQIKPGKEYEVYIGYHNNAAANLNSSGVGIAQQVRLSSQFPTKVSPSQKGTVSAIISASNTNPLEVWDEAYFTALEEISLHYKEGSAKIYNSFSSNGSVLPETLFSQTGTYLGANTLDGRLPGCGEFSGHVIYTLVAEAPAAKIQKTVSLDGKTFTENVKAKIGDEVTFKVVFENTGNTNISNVTFHDKFPTGLSLVPGSTYLYNDEHPDGELLTDLIDKNGYNTGLYGPKTKATITYKAKITKDALSSESCTANLVNTMYADHEGGEISDGATIILDEECIPSELPQTGPGEIALAVVAILCIGVGGTYWYRSRKAIKKITHDIEG